MDRFVKENEQKTTKHNLITHIKENKEVFIFFSSTILFICLSLYNSYFGIVAFSIDILALFTLSSDKILILLISIMPWAYVYKTSGISTSLFFILVSISTVKFLIETKKIERKYVGLLIFFVLNVMLHFSINVETTLVLFIKLVINLIFLYIICIIHKPKNVSAIQVFFILSVLISSLIAKAVPNRALFMNRIKLEGTLVEFQYERFLGLQNDPNYYNSSVTICLLFLCYLFIRREIKLSFFLLSFVFIYFGFLTYSKSFFLLLLMWAAVIVYYAFSKKRYLMTLVLLGIGIIGIMYLFSGRIQIINTIINRFDDSSGATTGRVDTWKNIIRYFIENPRVLIFGNGFESIVYQSHASHNSYIDMIYYFGLVGSIFLSLMIRICFRREELHNREPFAFIFLSFVFAIYFFLSGLTTCEIPFVIFFIFMFFNYSEMDSNEKESSQFRVSKCKYIKV